jgi:ribosome-binding protein aMBF1 (putative translation factor)
MAAKNGRRKPKTRWSRHSHGGSGTARIVHPLGKRRVRAGLSRKALSEHMDIAYTTLWRWETGGVTPPAYAVDYWSKSLVELS